MALLLAVLVFCGSLSYWIPQGAFERDAGNNIIPGTYEPGQVEGIALWRAITAPVRVFASEDALTIIMISVFLLVMSGVFNLLDKTGGIQIFIEHIMRRLRDSGGPVVCFTVLLLAIIRLRYFTDKVKIIVDKCQIPFLFLCRNTVVRIII